MDSIAKLTPESQKGKLMLKKGLFPARDKIMKTLGRTKVVEVHDDGDLTVKQGRDTLVVTTEGQAFRQIRKYPQHHIRAVKPCKPYTKTKVHHARRGRGMTRRSDR